MSDVEKNDRECLMKFHPLKLVDGKYHDNLWRKSRLLNIEGGELITKYEQLGLSTFYLLSGEIEQRNSFDDRQIISSDESQSEFPLEEKLHVGGKIRAVTDCQVLQLSRDLVDEYLSNSQDYGCNTGHAKPELADEEELLIGDDYEEPWMDFLLEAPLTHNLTPAALQTFLNTMETMPVDAGQVIIEKGTPGDYFYVLMSGRAELRTDPASGAGRSVVELISGDHFGEEALIADTHRNATITMVTNGTVGRLEGEQFLELFRDALVPLYHPGKGNDANEFVDGSEIIDVRLWSEYEHGHQPDSINIPISILRQEINKFDQKKVYLVTPEGGRRSELATCLLREHGFSAYLITSVPN